MFISGNSNEHIAALVYQYNLYNIINNCVADYSASRPEK